MWKEAQAKCWEIVPTKVTKGMNQVFIRPITLEEVKAIFIALPQGKAPHIDGIPQNSSKKTWMLPQRTFGRQ